MKSLLISMLMISLLVVSGCKETQETEEAETSTITATEESEDTDTEEDMKEEEEEVSDLPNFETIDEYMELVLNEEGEEYEVEKPEEFEPVLFGGDPTQFAPDGVPAEFVILVDENRDTSTGLHDDHVFYLESRNAIDESCYGDVLTAEDGEEVDCPTSTKWYGPFEGKAIEFVQ